MSSNPIFRFTRPFVFLAVLVAAGPAFAGRPNLAVTIDAPSGVMVGDEARYEVTVANIGNARADNVELIIDLPATNTSPQVFVLGDLGEVDTDCALSAQSLVCGVSRIARNRSAVFYFDIAFPQSAAPLVIDASASTTSNERSQDLWNNSASHTVSLDYYATPLSGDYEVVNRHCTGSGLVAFFECLCFPSSISSHGVTYNANNTITFPTIYGPGYTGTWSQPTPDSLVVDYYFGTDHVLHFEGDGVGGTCFEGISGFPTTTPYVAPYEICLTPL